MSFLLLLFIFLLSRSHTQISSQAQGRVRRGADFLIYCIILKPTALCRKYTPRIIVIMLPRSGFFSFFFFY